MLKSFNECDLGKRKEIRQRQVSLIWSERMWPVRKIGGNPQGSNVSCGFSIFSAYHSCSVIARSASRWRSTTCNPVKKHGNAVARLAPVETEEARSVGKGVAATNRLNLPSASRHSQIDAKDLNGNGTGKLKRLIEPEGKSRSAQSLTETVEMLYRDYLKTNHWKKLRRQKNKKRCAICGVKGPTDRHHLNYRHLFDVQKTDLRNVCRTCHDAIHLLLKSGKLVYANDKSDSRFALTKNAVKRYRFGSSNISREEVAALIAK